MTPVTRLQRTRVLVRECTRDSTRCTATPDARLTTPDCCVRWNVEVLKATIAPLNVAGIPWWEDYGMHLGYMVNGGFYPNDKDTDIGALVDDRAAVLALVPEWQRQGFHTRYYPVILKGRPWTWGDVLKVRLSARNHNNCDITFWFRRDDGYLDRTNYGSWDQWRGRAMPEAWIFPTTVGSWEGLAVNVPAEPEKLVAHRYGENWRALRPARHDGKRR